MSIPSSLTVVEYALPPFEEELKTYICECESCRACGKIHFLIPRLFFGGFIFPICWVLHLVLFIYTCYIMAHEIQFPRILDEDLPTLFELEMHHKCVSRPPTFSSAAENDTHQASTNNAQFQTANEPCPKTSMAPIDQFLAGARLEYLSDVSSDVTSSHAESSKYYRIWAIRTVGALLCYILLVIFVILTLRNSHNV
ncbi:LANO_0G04082g1_1 [Lachancea nothofagi CBS 11611]|uniref:LANO_0G04082g1_1 n=1 Tax=Lachancea nothofagi CBS 11611 TaxID=1266666 RepID=A0A1G4KFT1_9SACH|nr:LANO_0G04082g1_1 [Lachancea nothofagi CBS 11611]